ncbi:hypothetical protein LCGC14_2869660 [marine sediment metagenome]|uniref:Protein NO VEIN C-terminal domain-containing protein n=1 Tax=marine sediment metagenome TaxID=412755 RepID=A0A0F8YQ07_9ZZZZ
MTLYQSLDKIKEFRQTRENRKLFLSQIDELMREYRESYIEFKQVLEISPVLDSIDLKIGAKFTLNAKVFSDYNKIINKIGREGEKRVHEAFIEEFQDNPDINPIWENEEKESGKHYDIKLSNPSRTDEYIEVKTTNLF